MTAVYAGKWDTLPIELTPWISEVIQSLGHTHMTPVQSSTIPLFMKHKDVVVEAVTGSGKTLAFVIPILEKLVRREKRLRKHDIGALVISPTRELATQIHSVFSTFLSSQPEEDEEPLPPPLLLVSSQDSSPAEDVKRFSETGADIVIGTPGRVEEYLLGKGRNIVNVKELEVLVLDEADRLLDLGFQQSLTKIITHLPKQRRTGLFSATMTDADALSELVRAGLRNPARIVVKVQSKKGKEKETIEERRIPHNLQNYFVTCKPSEKLVQLTRIIKHEITQKQSSQFIVYFATGACVDYFFKILPQLLPSQTTFYSLHGQLPTSARTRTLSGFSSSISTPQMPSILLATDVAARGLDLPHVDVVIQFDPPTDPKAFSHRCGRTARAGRKGTAWVLLVDREVEYVDFMKIRKIPLKEHAYLPSSESNIDGREQEEGLDDLDVQDYIQRNRKLLLTDRALHDLAAKAFVSFVRAYSKHEASYIFRVKDLDLVGLAKTYGLVRLPRMPELKGIEITDWKDADVNWDDYSYADKAQEAKRLAEKKDKPSGAELERRRAERQKKKKMNQAWSDKVSKQEEKDKRQEKKSLKRKWLKANADAGKTAISSADKQDSGADDDGEDDWADLAKEERMAKKVRQGGISQAVFDAEFAMDL